jgi:hypothetical protein
MITLSDPFDQVPLSNPSKLFRLLKIEESRDGQIVCSFQVYEIEKCPSFIALSYAWGPSLPVTTIQLQGCPFSIRENLHLALSSIIEHKRRQSAHSSATNQISENLFEWNQAAGNDYKDTLFWVDQLCINQEDIHETNKQVAAMAKMYSAAFGVLVWLGEEGNGSAFAIPKIRQRQWKSPLDDARLGTAIGHMLDRPYWSRIWIIQEFFLARRVVMLCGLEMFAAEDLYAVIFGSDSSENTRQRIPSDYSNQFRPGFKMIQQYSPSRHFHEKFKPESNFLGSRLIDLIVRWGRNNCYDPRDKVYGLLGLLGPDFPHDRLRPDYGKPVEDLFVDVVHVVQTTCEKSLLEYDRVWNWLIRILGVSETHPTIKSILQEAGPGSKDNDASTNETSTETSNSNTPFEDLVKAMNAMHNDATITEMLLTFTELETFEGMELQAQATEDNMLLRGWKGK